MFVVLSGPTAAGKTSILKRIQEKRNIFLPVSYTTRKPRPGEINHQSYHFCSKAAFQTMIDNHDLIEYTERNSEYYGTAWSELTSAPAGSLLLLDLDCAGGFAVKEAFPGDVRLIFIAPPPPELATIRQRLRARNDNMSAEELQYRLDKAAEELRLAKYYDYIVVNDRLDAAVHEILVILDTLIESS